jgi:hypothetical protein
MLADSREFSLPDRLRLPFAFDAKELADDLDRLGDAGWTEHFVRQNYEGDWSAIALRAQAGATHPIMMIFSNPTATVFEDTPLLARLPSMRAALATFRCPLQAVRLMRLAPGSVIKEHCDHDLDAEHGMARLHVPVTTNPGVEFLLNGTPVAMAPGEVWYLRLADRHAVTNCGREDRINLVIDAVVDD